MFYRYGRYHWATDGVFIVAESRRMWVYEGDCPLYCVPTVDLIAYAF